MPNLERGSKTYRNLKDAFGIKSEASCRYLYFARQADKEGYPGVGGLFRDRAEAEMNHAHGHLDNLKAMGDAATESPIGSTSKKLRAAGAEDTDAHTKMYPGMARIARDEGCHRGVGA
jgi:rubrerythrin